MILSSSVSDEPETGRNLWVFTPSRTAPEDLEKIFVQRQDLLQDSVERLRESALTDHKHHLLFVGPRGCGKTHLITLLVNRLAADTQVTRKSRIAWLNEDETCTSLLELLIKIHTALEKRYPEDFKATEISDAYGLQPQAALELVRQRLLSKLGKRTLFVVTENLDSLFESLGDLGQKQLRAMIQKQPQFALIATAQRLVDDLTNRTRPFFGFFQTDHLKPLTVQEATTLLQKIARLRGKHEVAEFLQSGRGEARVRALHHLSGGNHRIYIVLSQFITRQSIDALIPPFLKMVDELTPYYQERLRWLPPLQRKIVEFLCGVEGTVAVKEIARKLFSSPQTISSQLHDLREKGYVESSQRGRESLYEISEPLMRICVEVKENQTTQPLRLIVDFLRVWYDDDELKKRMKDAVENTLTHTYLSSAFEKNLAEGSLRVRLLANEVFGRQANFEIASVGNLPESFYLMVACDLKGDLNGVSRHLDEMLRSGKKDEEIVARYCRGALHIRNGKYALAIKELNKLLSTCAPTPSRIIYTTLLLARARERSGDWRGAISDCSRVIMRTGVPSEALAEAHFIRATAYLLSIDTGSTISDLEKIIADFSQVTKIKNAPVNLVTCSRLFSASIRNGRDEESINDFTSVLNSLDLPTDLQCLALLKRGSAYRHLGQQDLARKDFMQILTNQDSSADYIVSANFAIAALEASEGKWDPAFAAIRAGLDLGARFDPPVVQSPSEFISVLFAAGLTTDGRKTQAQKLLSLYTAHHATSVVGEALVSQVGDAYCQGAPWPSSDNLAQWLVAWEQASANSLEMQLPLRLLRTAIRFINSGGKDRGILLDLTSTERSILRQALGLNESKD